MLVKTGFLPASIKTPEQAVAIMLTGRELGVAPMQSLRGINVIKGTPTVKPELMLALCVQRVPGFTYSFGRCTNESAEFICKRSERSEDYHSVFTMDDAKRAGLVSNQNWQQYPANMLRWRAVGNALHIVCPDVLVGIYTPDELGAATNEAGELIDEPQVVVSDEAISENGEDPPVDSVLVCSDCGNPIVGAALGKKHYTVHDLVQETQKKFKRNLCAACVKSISAQPAQPAPQEDLPQ